MTADSVTYKELLTLVLRYNLGARIISLKKVTGGLSHSVYKLKTEKAIFAIKALNPAIMQRKESHSNFVFSEKVARIAKQNGINAICALQFDGEVMLKVENRFFLVFDWLNGKTLQPTDVQTEHCQIIGQTLAKIHNIDFFELHHFKPQKMKAEQPDFASFIPPAREQHKPYASKLQKDLNLLLELNQLSAVAVNNLNGTLTISHADLDCKNVLWQNLTPFLIDWESSGYIYPTLELVQVAWYWAGGDVENLDRSKFEVFVKSYKNEYRGKMYTDYSDLFYASLNSKLAWLRYNLQRGLNTTDENIVDLSDNEVTKGLAELEYSIEQSGNVIQLLKACF